MDNARLRGLNRSYARKGGMVYESVIEELSSFLQNEQPSAFTFKPMFYPAHKKVSAVSVFDKSHSEIAALILSDLHVGETVRPEDSNGINRFNSVVAGNRLYAVIDKFKRIMRGHQSMYRIDKILIFLLGDLISGSIHDDLVLTNDLCDIPSVILVYRLLVIALLELKTLGLPITIECIVGNHSRTTIKMPTKRQAQTSYDWLVYVMLDNFFIDDKDVTINIHTGQFGLVKAYDHRIVIEHGYGTQIGKEQELEVKIRNIFDSPTYRKATGMDGTSVDFVIIGDKHNFKVGERYMVNGCLPGATETGLSWRLPPIGAVQAMFGISRKRIPSWVYPLEVSSVMSESADNPMSVLAKTFVKENGKS